MFYKDVEQFKSLSGYEIDGVWYPRVTKILEIKAKPALYFYYAEAQNYAQAQAQTKKSAEEGTLIHETVEKIMVGQKPEIDPSIGPAVKECVRFMQERNIQIDPANVERRVFSPEHKYAGTIDTLALIDGKFGVLDIKTSQAIYRDYGLQTAAYVDALLGDPLLAGLETRWILRIDQNKTCYRCGSILRTKGGKDKIRPPAVKMGPICKDDQHEWGELRGVTELKELPNWQNDFQAFLGAKKLWEWENEYWLKKIRIGQ